MFDGSIQTVNETSPRTEVVARQYIHSCMVRDYKRDIDCIVVKERQFYSDDTVKSKLRFIKDPKRSFYVTKSGLRSTYTEKKEWELVQNLDKYVVKDRDLGNEIFTALNGYRPRNYVNKRELVMNPYVYGADIGVDSLMIRKLTEDFKNSGKQRTSIKAGFFDTETSMLEGPRWPNLKLGDLLCATITDRNNVYTAIHKDFLFKKEGDQIVPGTVEELDAYSRKVFDEVEVTIGKKSQTVSSFGWNYHYYIAESRVDMLKWLFDKVNQTDIDFLGVWNLDFDIKVILRTCEEADVNVADIFSPPEVPERLRYFRYVKDENMAVDHPTRRWHWVHSTGMTQFYDAAQLYSRLRIVDGFESNYRLDTILDKNIKKGKLKFTHLVDPEKMSDQDWHRYMQSNHPYEYIIYNQFDCMGLQIQEIKNADVTGMVTLAADNATPLCNFNKQTRRAANEMYFECLEEGRVVGSAYNLIDNLDDAKLEELFEKLAKEGGAVLHTERTDGVGLPVIRQRPGFETYVSFNNNDIDLASIYPNVMITINISRETRISTIVVINGFSEYKTQMFVAMVISVNENAVPICTEYFNLPGYEEMDRLFRERVLGQVVVANQGVQIVQRPMVSVA